MEESRLEHALTLMDAKNATDPNQVSVDDQQYPKELLYAQRMSAQLAAFESTASEVLKLAARAQHIGRWEILRSSYPDGRVGYLTWRNDLKVLHADTAAAILKEVGFGEDDIDRVRFLIQKKQLKKDQETQTLEDVVCLVFLEHYSDAFAAKETPEKMIDIIRKTWNKMSEKGQAAAKKLPLSDQVLQLVVRALEV